MALKSQAKTEYYSDLHCARTHGAKAWNLQFPQCTDGMT